MCTRGLFFYSSSSACFTKMKRIREARGGEREAAARQKKDRRKISKVTLSTYYSSLDLEVRPWAFFCWGISPQISPSCPLGRAFGRPKKTQRWGGGGWRLMRADNIIGHGRRREIIIWDSFSSRFHSTPLLPLIQNFLWPSIIESRRNSARLDCGRVRKKTFQVLLNCYLKSKPPF